MLINVKMARPKLTFFFHQKLRKERKKRVLTGDVKTKSWVKVDHLLTHLSVNIDTCLPMRGVRMSKIYHYVIVFYITIHCAGPL